MAYTTRKKWETLRVLDSATLTGGYLALGTPLLFPSAILKLVNNSTVLVTISVDGINDNDVAPAGSLWLYDEDNGGQERQTVSAGTQILVKGSAGVGNIYLVSQYLLVN